MSKSLLNYQISRVASIEAEEDAITTRLQQKRAMGESGEEISSLLLREGVNIRVNLARWNLWLTKATRFIIDYHTYMAEEKVKRPEEKVPILRKRAYQALTEKVEQEINKRKRDYHYVWVNEI